jgi:hypothetical protein
LAALAGPIREFIFHNYLQAAATAFIAFASFAVTSYRKSRKRLLGHS